MVNYCALLCIIEGKLWDSAKFYENPFDYALHTNDLAA